VQGTPASVTVEAACQCAAAGSLQLRSAAANSATWTEHLRGSVRLLQQPPASEPSTKFHDNHRRSNAADSAAALHLHQPQRMVGATGGVTAGLDVGRKHAAPGYGVHPAAADAALHCGAVDPAAPRDGRTRVPAALGALHAGGKDAAQQVWPKCHAERVCRF
jgi:Polyketide synthase dehydratase